MDLKNIGIPGRNRGKSTGRSSNAVYHGYDLQTSTFQDGRSEDDERPKITASQ